MLFVCFDIGFDANLCMFPGTTASVYRGVFQEQNVAIKCFTPKELTRRVISKFEEEYQLLTGLQHPNIIHVHGLVAQPPYLCLVFELCEKGELTDHIKHLSRSPWPQKLALLRDMAAAVAHIHCQQPPVVHRDIKPANFLLRADWTPVMADFGSSKHVSSQDEHLSTFAGSPLYMAPEVLRKDLYDRSVDVYSLAIMFWQTLSGVLPFAQDLRDKSFNLDKLRDKIVGGGRPALDGKTFAGAPDGLANLLEVCWSTDPAQRPTAHQVFCELQRLCQLATAADSEIENLL
jgi:serine/threonine protein kinase